MKASLAIFGAGGFGKEVRSILPAEYNFLGFFDDHDRSGFVKGKWLGNTQQLNEWREPLNVIIAMGRPDIRFTCFKNLSNPLLTFPSIISERSLLGDKESISVAEGAIIAPGANLTTDIKLHRFSIININATIGHDVAVGAFASIMPGVNISGNVKIGDRVFIGSGATILQGISVGEDAVIGAGAVVIRDVPSGCTVVGVPARIVKQR